MDHECPLPLEFEGIFWDGKIMLFVYFVIFLMGGWEGLFKMGQATPPFRASISPSVNCRYDY